MGFMVLAVLVSQMMRINDDLPFVDKLQIQERINHFQFERNILDKLHAETGRTTLLS